MPSKIMFMFIQYVHGVGHVCCSVVDATFLCSGRVYVINPFTGRYFVNLLCFV